MELNKLSGFVLLMVFVGMLIGVGIIVLDSLGDAAKVSTTVTDEVEVFTATVGATTYDDVTSFTNITNGTVYCDDFNRLGSCANWTTPGVVTIGRGNFTNVAGQYNLSYVYDADSGTTTATSNTVSSIATIASTWLPLIITVVILALILVLVMGAFNRHR